MKEKVIRILTNITERELAEITEDMELAADLGLNSLDVMDAIVAFEEEFQTEIPDDAIAELVTVGDVVWWLERHSYVQ